MRAFFLVILSLGLGACDTNDVGPFTDGGGPADGAVADASVGDPPDEAVADADVDSRRPEPDLGPFVRLNAIQVKGYHRSDWASLDPDPTRDVDYLGHDRPLIGEQVTALDARVFHFGWHPQSLSACRFGGFSGWGMTEPRAPEDDGDCEDVIFDDRTAPQSQCGEFVPVCLTDIRVGSGPFGGEEGGVDELPTERHAPIFVLIEPQANLLDEETYACFDRNSLWAYGYDPPNALICLEVNPIRDFEPGDVFTPNELQGDFETLRDAVLTRGWPGMEDLWGRYVFILLDKGDVREAYRERRFLDDPDLGTRADNPHFFTVADDPEDPDAAFFSLPASETERISELVEAGFIVHAHSLDAAEIDAARRAGAHLLTALELDDIDTDRAAVCNPVAPSEVACEHNHFARPTLLGR